jgi:RNA recognition motif-containing protein
VGSSVFVRNLPKGATENQVAALFACIGELVDVQVDNGPLPTATVGFVRQDAAFKASQRFHGHWLQGEQLKVSLNVTGAISSAGPEEDDEFWRRELLEMSIRRKQPEDKRQQLKLSQHGDGDDSRGKPPAADDEFWREELAEMRKRQRLQPMACTNDALHVASLRSSNGRSSNGHSHLQSVASRSSNGHSQLQSVVIESDDDDFWLEELAQMKRRRRHIGGMEKAVSVGQPSHLGQRPVRQRRGRGNFMA